MDRFRALLARTARPAVALPLLAVAAVVWVMVARAWLAELPVRRHLARGMEYARQGLGAETEREWRAALRRDRRSAEACQLLASYYLSSQRWLAAAEMLRKLRELRPQEPHLSCQLAGALLSARDEVGAYREAEAELKQAPECVPALAIAAAMLGQVNDEKRRLDYLRRLGRLRPEDPDLLFMLGDGLTDGLAHAEARSVLERVVALDPEYAEAHTLLGEGWLQERAAPDRLARAEAHLTRALSLQPLNGRARHALGRVYLEQGKAKAAVLQLEEAARLLPYSFRVPFELARAHQAAGDPSRAAVARKRFLTLRQLASSEATLQKRCATDPGNFDAHLALGTLYLQKEEYRKALLYLQKARDLRPDHPRLLAALRSLSNQSGHDARLAAAQAQLPPAKATPAAAPGTYPASALGGATPPWGGPLAPSKARRSVSPAP